MWTLEPRASRSRSPRGHRWLPGNAVVDTRLSLAAISFKSTYPVTKAAPPPYFHKFDARLRTRLVFLRPPRRTSRATSSPRFVRSGLPSKKGKNRRNKWLRSPSTNYLSGPSGDRRGAWRSPLKANQRRSSRWRTPGPPMPFLSRTSLPKFASFLGPIHQILAALQAWRLLSIASEFVVWQGVLQRRDSWLRGVRNVTIARRLDTTTLKSPSGFPFPRERGESSLGAPCNRSSKRAYTTNPPAVPASCVKAQNASKRIELSVKELRDVAFAS